MAKFQVGQKVRIVESIYTQYGSEEYAEGNIGTVVPSHHFPGDHGVHVKVAGGQDEDTNGPQEGLFFLNEWLEAVEEPQTPAADGDGFIDLRPAAGELVAQEFTIGDKVRIPEKYIGGPIWVPEMEAMAGQVGEVTYYDNRDDTYSVSVNGTEFWHAAKALTAA